MLVPLNLLKSRYKNPLYLIKRCIYALLSILIIINPICFFLMPNLYHHRKNYKHLLFQEKRYLNEIYKLHDHQKLYITQKTYQKNIELYNHRVKIFSWYFGWCAKWLCLGGKNLNWQQLDWQYDQKEHIVKTKLAILGNAAEAKGFVNWLNASKMLTHATIAEFSPQKNDWKAVIVGEKLL